ncbi:hypothetical protein XENTR_v10009501 [Xenopus tropicalis]|nr:hypothetical protein XENTR_v10009501 [Xenopus tropicalis]
MSLISQKLSKCALSFICSLHFCVTNILLKTMLSFHGNRRKPTELQMADFLKNKTVPPAIKMPTLVVRRTKTALDKVNKTTQRNLCRKNDSFRQTH